jgi:iron-sulfur cluster repair protein YtfE (RIC family)
MSMDPSEVRERILREHVALREALVLLGDALDAGDAGDADRFEEARSRTAKLCSQLNSHTELEDRVLVPALREADSWGEVRAAKLLVHHREQREELKLLAEQAHSLAPAAFSQRAHALINDVIADMLHEEAAIINDRVLRDDVIGIDVEAG